MRRVTLLNLAHVQDPTVRAALQELMSASGDNVVNDLTAGGNGLASITGAAANTVPYFTSPTVAVAVTLASISYTPQVISSANRTTILTDAQGHIYHPTSDNNPRTWTIASNASVPYPIGTTLKFVNRINTITLAITSDTLLWMPTQATGPRTLAAGAVAEAMKTATTEWVLTGVGIT